MPDVHRWTEPISTYFNSLLNYFVSKNRSPFKIEAFTLVFLKQCICE